MMQNMSKVRFSALALAVFATSALAGGLLFHPSQPAIQHETAHASWVSEASTVAEQIQEADLVVRVQAVDRGETRYLWSPTPDGVERKDGRSTFAFTDTQVEVLDVYMGDAEVGDRLSILQTGGDLVTKSGELSRFELADDPIYQLGGEMLLFLVDISADPVHAKGRELFRTVNPAGRYELEGELASQKAFGPNQKAVATDLENLEAQIAKAVAERADLQI